MSKSLKPNKTKLVGPYVLDRTTVGIGETIVLDGFGGDYFQDGDELKVIGFGECTETLGDLYNDDENSGAYLRSVYFPMGEYKEVTYQVAVYDRRNGKMNKIAEIYPNETEQCEKVKWVDDASRLQTRALKKSIKALYAAGLNNDARVLEGMRRELGKGILKERRKTIKERIERDHREAAPVIARLARGQKVRVTYKDAESLEIKQVDAVLGSFGDHTMVGTRLSFSEMLSMGPGSIKWIDVRRIEVLPETSEDQNESAAA